LLKSDVLDGQKKSAFGRSFCAVKVLLLDKRFGSALLHCWQQNNQQHQQANDQQASG
jgi:hypothetical protein